MKALIGRMSTLKIPTNVTQAAFTLRGIFRNFTGSRMCYGYPGRPTAERQLTCRCATWCRLSISDC